MDITILLVATIAAILSGVSIFTSTAPDPPKPDPRIADLLEALKAFEEDINRTLEAMQKNLLMTEHRLKKDIAAHKEELKAHLDNHVASLQKTITDLMTIVEEEEE